MTDGADKASGKRRLGCECNCKCHEQPESPARSDDPRGFLVVLYGVVRSSGPDSLDNSQDRHAFTGTGTRLRHVRDVRGDSGGGHAGRAGRPASSGASAGPGRRTATPSRPPSGGSRRARRRSTSSIWTGPSRGATERRGHRCGARRRRRGGATGRWHPHCGGRRLPARPRRRPGHSQGRRPWRTPTSWPRSATNIPVVSSSASTPRTARSSSRVDRGDRTRPAEAAGRYTRTWAPAPSLFTDVDVEGQLEGFGPTRSSASPKRSISRSSPAAASRRWTTSWWPCGTPAPAPSSSGARCTRDASHWLTRGTLVAPD